MLTGKRVINYRIKDFTANNMENVCNFTSGFREEV